MIKAETLATIAEQIDTTKLDDNLIAILRKEFAPVHFSYCSDDDIFNHQPVLEREQFNLYLIDGREHCLCLTQNLDNATGVLVAEIY